MQSLCFIKYCALTIVSFGLNNGIIEAPAVEFSSQRQSPSEVAAVIHN